MSNQPSERPRGIDALLHPFSIAVIGASDDPNRIGGRPIRYMRQSRFEGSMYAVNPNHIQVQGLVSYPDVASVPDEIDLAIVAVPAPVVPATLEACATKQVASAIVFSAGFAETDPAGDASQRHIASIARTNGMRILGPNCLGVYNADIGLFATFSTTLEDRLPRPGPIGLVSQSGAYGSHLSLLAARRNMGIRYWVTTGNESDITVPEVIEWLANRADVSVIVAYAEGTKKPDTLQRALETARANRKPVVFMKVGTTDIGAAAVRSHTATFAGSDAVYDAMLRQFGAYRTHSTEDMLDVAYAASFEVLPRSRRVALMSISGGVGVQMADAAVRAGLEVTAMTEDAQARLKRDLPFAAPRNPVDITAQAFNDIRLVSNNLQLILDDGRYDSVIAFFTYVAAAAKMVRPIREILTTAKAQHPSTVLVVSMVGPPEVIRQYEAAGCPVFEDPIRGVRAVAALTYFREQFDHHRTPARVRRAAESALPAGPLNECTAAALFARSGVPMIEMRLVSTPDEAIKTARRLGFPVVMKLCSREVAHTSDIGGIAPRVDRGSVRSTFERLHRLAVTEHVVFEGVLIGPMADQGVDTIIGVHRDPTFGPVVSVSLGGGLKILDDVSFRLPPFDTDEAHHMIRDLEGFPLFAGQRGQPACDVEALAASLVRLSEFAATHGPRLENAEINPLRVLPEGHGVVGLDAVVVLRTEEGLLGKRPSS